MPFPRVPIGCLKLSQKAKRYVNQVLNSNRLTYGPFTEKFESLFAKMHGVRFAIASNSGTASLQTAVAALKERYRWPDNSEVLVPATTFIATSNIVIYNRLKPVFVEIDPVHYEITSENCAKKITKKTRGLIPVHLFGQPADMDPLMSFAHKNKLRVVEDSAQTVLANYRGRKVGGFGDISCFSTYAAHLLTTGVGGLSLTSDPGLAVMLRSLINHGRDSIYLNIDSDNKAGAKKIRLIAKKRFSFVRLGHSARITDLESAIGLAQLEDELTDQIRIRQKNATLLTKLLAPAEEYIQLPKIRPGNTHSFMMYPIVLRKRFKNAKRKLVGLLEEKGVETRDLVPLINQPVYKKMFGISSRDYPVSQWLIDCGFYVGCHQALKHADLEQVSRIILGYLKKNA